MPPAPMPEPHTQPSPHMWRLLLAYDGTDFAGWQVQPGRRTIQGTLAGAVQTIFGISTLPQGSGRTDAGVHAEAQVVSLHLPIEVPPARLLQALNRRLPSSIRVLSAERAPADFHARANVRSKTYEYRIFPRVFPRFNDEERICPPFTARFAWDCRWPLSLDPLQTAARLLTGTHDFTAFASTDPDRTGRMQAGGAHTPTNTRTIFRSCWTERDGLLVYQVSGSGFLHHMVRNLVGTMVEIGAGRRQPHSILTTLHARNRALSGPTAPPQGLSLLRVDYGDSFPQTPGSAVSG